MYRLSKEESWFSSVTESESMQWQRGSLLGFADTPIPFLIAAGDFAIDFRLRRVFVDFRALYSRLLLTILDGVDFAEGGRSGKQSIARKSRHVPSTIAWGAVVAARALG